MLKIWPFLSPKNEKRPEFLPRLQKKIELCSIFLQPSVAF